MVWEQTDYDTAYQRSVGGIYVPSYRRDIFGPGDSDSAEAWIDRAQQWGLKLAGAVNPASHLLVVGCGFGWIIETIIDQFNHQRVWGTDISTWIQTEKATHARADVAPLILNIDIAAGNARQQFQQAGAGQQGRFDWVVTEHVVEGIDPADLAGFLDDCEAVLRPQGEVAHIVASELTPPGPDDVHDRTLGIRWRTLADWAAERPSHYWLDVHGWVLAGGV